MALQNPSNLYSGGQGILDSRQSLAFKANLLAKEKAKKDALDQYFNKSLTDVTPSGMRSKDIVGGWAQKAKDWKDFAIQNKEAILNPQKDNYQAVTQFNRIHKELLAEAERSKNELKDEIMLNKERMEGKWNPTDDDLIILDRKSKSIYDTSRYDELGNDVDMAQISFNIPQFDTTRQAKADKAIFGSIKGAKSYDEAKAIQNKETGQVVMPFVETFTPENIKQIGDNAAKMASTDKSMRKAYNDFLINNPEMVENAANYLKQFTGKDEVIDTPEKLAKADYMLKASNYVKRGEDVRTDWQYKMEKQYNYNVAMQDKRHQQALERLTKGFSLRDTFGDIKDAKTIGKLDEFFETKENNATPVPQIFVNMGLASKDDVVLEMSPIEMKVFKKEIPVLDEEGKVKMSTSGVPLTKEVLPKYMLYNKATKEYMPVGEGYEGMKFSRPELTISYLNNIANTAPKIGILGGKGVNLGTNKSGTKGTRSIKVKGAKTTPLIKGTKNRLY